MATKRCEIQAYAVRDLRFVHAEGVRLRCDIEPEVFLSVMANATAITTSLHHLQCPVVFASGSPDAADTPEPHKFPVLLPRAARQLAQRGLDCAYLPMHLQSHFMPFVQPQQLADALVHVFCAPQRHGLRAHIRWLGTAWQQQAKGLPHSAAAAHAARL